MEEVRVGGLNVSFSEHLCAGIFVLTDNVKRKMSTLVYKKNQKQGIQRLQSACSVYDR